MTTLSLAEKGNYDPANAMYFLDICIATIIKQPSIFDNMKYLY